MRVTFSLPSIDIATATAQCHQLLAIVFGALVLAGQPALFWIGFWLNVWSSVPSFLLRSTGGKEMPRHQALLAPCFLKGLAAGCAGLLLALALSLPALAEIELFGGNPLLEAIKANDPQRVETAITNGEKVNVQDFDGRSPLIYATLVGNLDIIDILTKRSAQVNHQDKLGNTALFYAANRGDVDIGEALIEAGAKKDIDNRQGITPLMIAAKLGNLDVLQLLLAKGANPNLRDFTGRSALMWAEWNRKSTVVRVLRKAGVRE